MRIGDLSRRAGVPVPTIKYYLREGLLAAGVLTSPNQARYDESHLRRLTLVRALIEVGGLSVAGTRRVLEQISTPDISVHVAMGKTQYALTTPKDRVPDERWHAAALRTEALIERRGWRVRPTNPARDTLTELLVTIDELGQDDVLGLLDDYAGCAERLAAADIDLVGRRAGVESMLEAVVVATVLGDVMIHALRRLAQEDASERAFEPGDHQR